uniref:Si:ch73-130a3.4 n=1 Tax=Erpetoichthys calabaricus TaxID=27687 RepID=A0A8C4REA8_ERPCA
VVDKGAAWDCTNRCTLQTRFRLHFISKAEQLFWKQWEVALRREGFSANDASRLCSEHFRQEDFDWTGQIVKIKDGALPSVFRFPTHLQREIILRKLSCDVCHASLVTDAVPASYDQSYHSLTLKNKGGLMIPSEVSREREREIERGISEMFSEIKPICIQ